MAARRGPTDSKRFKRAAPSGNHKKKTTTARKGIDRARGETLWTQELQDKLVKLIQAGNYAEVAARACGISKATFYEWLQRGGRGEEPFKALADAVENATAEAEARDVLVIGRAAEKQWQAAAWRLERKSPKRWGRKDGLEITGDSEKPVAISVLKWGDKEVEFT